MLNRLFEILLKLLESQLICVIVGFAVGYYFQRRDKKSDEKKQIESFLNSIKTEISSIWERYYEVVGKSIENSNQNEGFASYYPIFDNYFIVYDNNTNLIGKLDKELSQVLVKTYIMAKGLKDSFIVTIHQNIKKMKKNLYILDKTLDRFFLKFSDFQSDFITQPN